MKKLVYGIVTFLLFFIVLISLSYLIRFNTNRVGLDKNGFEVFVASNQNLHFDLYSLVSRLQDYNVGGFGVTWEMVTQSFNDFLNSGMLNSGAVGSIMHIVNGNAGVQDWFMALSGVGVVNDLFIVPITFLMPVIVFIGYLFSNVIAFVGLMFDIITGDFFFIK